MGSNPNVSILWKKKLWVQISNMDNNNKQTAEIQQKSKKTAENQLKSKQIWTFWNSVLQ